MKWCLNLDLAPTLLEIAGLPVPGEMQGKSMLPLAEGKAERLMAERLALRVLRVSRDSRTCAPAAA